MTEVHKRLDDADGVARYGRPAACERVHGAVTGHGKYPPPPLAYARAAAEQHGPGQYIVRAEDSIYVFDIEAAPNNPVAPYTVTSINR